MTDEEMADWLAGVTVDGKEIARRFMATFDAQQEVNVFSVLSALKMMRESLIMCAQADMNQNECDVFVKQVELVELSSAIAGNLKK